MSRWSSLSPRRRFQIRSLVWSLPLLLAIYGASTGFGPSSEMVGKAVYIAAPLGLLLAITMPRAADRPPLRFGQIVFLVLVGPPLAYGLAFFTVAFGAGHLINEATGRPETQHFVVVDKTDRRWKLLPGCGLKIRLEHRDSGERVTPCISEELWNRLALKQEVLLLVHASWAGTRALRDASPAEAASSAAR
ncbi:hypothetical protein [Mitsuaria sp. 7]|uniref:hypothetical protein n=1 Tax=Mitsuaria sp. 7 TaxID=1658665 RepID=UPI0007DD1F92|nr:hypothetical protein [Mitsuaria sp. 7]ANH68873.1 hypothetical protein ABE85_17175 [Mitsuaria sp. 7]